MRIRAKSIIAGPRFCADAGKIVDVSVEDAEEMCAAGVAEMVDHQPVRSAQPEAPQLPLLQTVNPADETAAADVDKTVSGENPPGDEGAEETTENSSGEQSEKSPDETAMNEAAENTAMQRRRGRKAQ